MQGFYEELNQQEQQVIDQLRKFSEIDDQNKDQFLLFQIKFDKEKDCLFEGLKFFNENTGSIEILRDDFLYRVYFPIHPTSKILDKVQKRNFHKLVNRSSINTKISYLMQQKDLLLKYMSCEYDLQSINRVSRIIIEHDYIWSMGAFFTILLLNIVILLSYSAEFKDKNTDGYDQYDHYRLFEPRFLFDSQYTQTQSVMTLIGVVNMIFSGMSVALFMLKRWPVLLGDFYNQQTFEIAKIIEDINQQFIIFCSEFIVSFKKNLDNKDQKSQVYIIAKSIQMILKLIITSSIVLLEDIEIKLKVVYILLNLFGQVIHPFFWAINLLINVLQTEYLVNIVKSVYLQINEISTTFCVFILFNYYFSIFAYLYLYKLYNPSGGDSTLDTSNNWLCDSLFNCWTTTILYSLKGGGGLGSMIYDEIYPDPKDAYKVYNGSESRFQKKFIFDNIVFIISLLLLINMVAGIIIDKFGNLRDEFMASKIDQENVCFICGLEKKQLEKINRRQFGFLEHIKKNHYMWNYIAFQDHLDVIDESDYNGNELYIYNMVQNGDIGWFPIGRTIGYQDEEDNLNENIEEFQELQKQFQKLNQDLKQQLIRRKEKIDEHQNK